MIRWKVRKSPSGKWWAHEPLCTGSGGLWCMLFNQCVDFETFRKAFMYAETRAGMDARNFRPFRAVSVK